MFRVYKFIYAVLAMLICVLLIASCRKNLPGCRNNCYSITISGSIYDKTNGAPFGNVPVSVTFFRKAYCIGCISYKVASGISKPDGSFSFTTTIDTAFFREYHMTVRIPQDSNYISMPTGGGIHFVEEDFYDFNPTAFQGIKFEFYPKTSLTIRLHRVQNDAWQYFSVTHTFMTGFGYGDYVITGQQNARDSIKVVPTSADIYTKIIWAKKTAGIIIQETRDSIICTKAGPNRYDIYY